MSAARQGMVALGPMVQRVVVTAVDTAQRRCVVRNTAGREFTMDLSIERTPFVPRVGEKWLIDRTLGLWTMAARLTVVAPSALVLTDADGVRWALSMSTTGQPTSTTL